LATDAADDLERICDDIAETNPDSARRIARTIVDMSLSAVEVAGALT
jgi:plasmid stabilization system protein ParE